MTLARAVCDGSIICLDDFMHSGFPGVMEGTFNYFHNQTGVLFPLCYKQEQTVAHELCTCQSASI